MFYEPSTLAMTVNVLATSLREEYGIDPAPVFRAAGIDPNRRNTPQCRYPLSTMKKLWDTAVATTGDPTVGLKTGWHITPALFVGFTAGDGVEGRKAPDGDHLVYTVVFSLMSSGSWIAYLVH
ncbi:MAG: AraC family transcriptional regulator [Gammaproteobacteria bacterium]|nr:AraC family transcriptional regulator [Gammaproteobacteria bacterium]